MGRSPFGRCHEIRTSLLFGMLLLGVGVVEHVAGRDRLSAEQPATKPKPDLFKGTWDGTFVDDQGTKGKGKYTFHAEKDGRLEVTVSWKYQGGVGKMDLEGKRLGLDAMHLEGKSDGVTYKYIGRMVSGKLILQYLSIEATTGKSGSGVSTLTRQ